MTEHKTMNTVIHAAFRRDLARFDAALTGFTDGNRSRAEQLGAAWDNYATQLRQHHDDEEEHFWPALRELGADESMVGDLDGEHERMLTALEQADAAMAALRTDPTSSRAAAAHDAMSSFGTILTDHLAHEERDLEPFSASHHNTPQVKAAQAAVRKAHMRTVGTFLAWMMDEADADAVAQIRRDLPPPVFFAVNRFGGRDYRSRIAPVWAQ